MRAADDLASPAAPLWGAGVAALVASNVAFGALFAGMALRNRVPVYASGRPTPAGWWWFGGYSTLVGLLAIAAIAIGLWTMRRLRALDGPVQPYKYARIGAGLGAVVLLFGVLPIGRQLTEFLGTAPPSVFELEGDAQAAALAAMPAPERAKVARYVWSTRGAPVDDPVPVLLLLLLDADPVVRLEAVRGMGSRGAWDPRATRPLLRALQDPDIRVVRSAAFGAAHLDPRPAEMLPIAVEVLLNPPAAQAGADGATIRKECLEQLVFLVYLLGRRPDARNAMRRLWKDPRLPETARAELQWRMRQLRIDPASPMEPE